MRLNREQYRASRSGTGIELVLAGAGTGKSKTLIEKIRSLLAWTELKEENLLVLTFSRKAVEELRNRLGHEGGSGTGAVTVETFHSFCWMLLRKYGGSFFQESGYERFPGIMDESHSRKALKEIVLESIHAMKGIPADVICRLALSPAVEPSLQEKLVRSGLARELERIGTLYGEYKAARCLVDFHDMVHLCVTMLEKNPDLLRRVQGTYRYILVDEFQDTSREQFHLLEILTAGPGNGLFVVGDDWQAIYGFRNARVEYIINMKEYFPRARVYALHRNYRSRKEIVVLSNRFIRHNRNRTSKKLVSCRGKGGSVLHHRVSGLDQEAPVIDGILAGCPAGDAVVLYRNNWQGEYLRRHVTCEREDLDVSFLTMHGSKGLEFGTVIISGISDAIIPDRSSFLEEERRLFYVALTRARDNLHLLSHIGARGELPRFCRELGLK